MGTKMYGVWPGHLPTLEHLANPRSSWVKVSKSVFFSMGMRAHVKIKRNNKGETYIYSRLYTMVGFHPALIWHEGRKFYVKDYMLPKSKRPVRRRIISLISDRTPGEATMASRKLLKVIRYHAWDDGNKITIFRDTMPDHLRLKIKTGYPTEVIRKWLDEAGYGPYLPEHGIHLAEYGWGRGETNNYLDWSVLRVFFQPNNTAVDNHAKE